MKRWIKNLLIGKESKGIASKKRAKSRLFAQCPDAKVFSKLKKVSLPHVEYLVKPCHQSPELNTDRWGFRVSIKDNKTYSFEDFQGSPLKKVLVLGNSTAFGVNVGGDQNTVVNQLNQRDEERIYFNGAMRVFTFRQMLYLFESFLPKVDEVYLLCGFNDLALAHSSEIKCLSPVFGAVFGKRLFNKFKGGEYLSDQKTLGLEEDNKHENLYQCLEKDFFIWKALSEKMGFTLSYVLQPLLGWVSKEWSESEKIGAELFDKHLSNVDLSIYDQYEVYRERISSICEQHNFFFHDSNPAFQSKESLFIDRVHLSKEGHRVWAEDILAAQRNSTGDLL